MNKRKRKGKVSWFVVILLLIIGLSVYHNHQTTNTTGEDTITTSSKNTHDSLSALPAGDSLYTDDIDDGDMRSTLLCPAPIKNVSEQLLSRKGYITSYNADTRCPNWVAWHLTAAHVDGTAKRPGRAFHEDDEVARPRATYNDYLHSGYSRGHMCPAADNKWDAVAMNESFLMTNICPQNGQLNTGRWNEIESACRKWAKQYGDVYIVTGPLFVKQKHDVIGQNEVAVPDAFFKVVLRVNGTPKGIAFVCQNTDESTEQNNVKSIDQVERLAGIDFFPNLPDKTEQAVEAEANANDWEW